MVVGTYYIIPYLKKINHQLVFKFCPSSLSFEKKIHFHIFVDPKLKVIVIPII